MPSISEQLQKYRLLIGSTTRRPVSDAPHTAPWQHPDTRDYFSNLMQEWRKENADGAMVETRP